MPIPEAEVTCRGLSAIHRPEDRERRWLDSSISKGLIPQCFVLAVAAQIPLSERRPQGLDHADEPAQLIQLILERRGDGWANQSSNFGEQCALHGSKTVSKPG
ncbi:hypothetical protein CBM2608_A290001 [Cupriavidus taiwanensis]|nr:hypothetical protein CBM2608_A290001 [Cupriavidus taiwanensis]